MAILLPICHVLTVSAVDVQSFWSRLAGKYGNKFYWQEKGEAASILNAVSGAGGVGGWVSGPAGQLEAVDLCA